MYNPGASLMVPVNVRHAPDASSLPPSLLAEEVLMYHRAASRLAQMCPAIIVEQVRGAAGHALPADLFLRWFLCFLNYGVAASWRRLQWLVSSGRQ